MNIPKILFVCSLYFILSACASAVSRQHNFEVVESPSIQSDCKIQQMNRRAIIPQKDGTLYILAQNSSRITWMGIPFIPLIPTFINSSKFNSLRLDVEYRDKNNNASSGISSDGWLLRLDDQVVKGQVTPYEYEIDSKKYYSAMITFEFSPIDAKNISIDVPSFQNRQGSTTLHLQRHLESQYFAFASGLTHYTSSLCPESPRQSFHNWPGI